ncbi:MAG TPA: hypothetical protein VE997_07280, partial [Candidatus Limnocylindria bacterium]|nr:hypothetical protein [Candidatus Limnocylindria bacterium]
MTGRYSHAIGLAAAAALAAVPLVVRRDDVLNFLFLVLLSVTLAESWNIVAGYAGQVNLGHAAFYRARRPDDPCALDCRGAG